MTSTGSNLCERKIIVGKFKASHLLHDLYFNEVGGPWNADGNSGDDNNLFSF